MSAKDNIKELKEFVKLRREYTMKLVEMESDEQDLWRGVAKELNDEIEEWKQIEGLEGIEQFGVGGHTNNYKLTVRFRCSIDEHFYPTLKGLMKIEEKTGLRMLGNPNNLSVFEFVIL